MPTGEIQANDPIPGWVHDQVRTRIDYTQFVGPTCDSFEEPPEDATDAEIRSTVERWLTYNPTRVINGRLQSLYPHIAVPQCIQSWMESTRVTALEDTETETAPNPANVAVNPPLAADAMDAESAHADGDKKMPAKETRAGKPVTKKAEANDEDKKMPAKGRSQRPNKTTTTETDTAATSNILPSLDDLFLTEEEKVFIEDHIIPWLSDNDYTLEDDGTFYSDSIIPPVVQQWLIGRGARLSAAPPTVAASDAAPPPDATDDEIADAVDEWIRSHQVIMTNGVMRCLDPDQTVPKCVQDRVAYNLAQIVSLKDNARKANRIPQQLPAKRKAPAANAEDTHPASTTVTVNTNDPPAVETEDNPSDTAENATIDIDAQGDTAEDPIVINESTSNSDSDLADETETH